MLVSKSLQFSGLLVSAILIHEFGNNPIGIDFLKQTVDEDFPKSGG